MTSQIQGFVSCGVDELVSHCCFVERKETPCFKTMAVDSDAIRQAYEDVRSDSSSTIWAVFKYADNNIIYEEADHGESYDDLLNFCNEEDRFYAYVRLETGDEMSKRAKFVLITWVGNGVRPLKKAKVSTDKTLIKELCPNFAAEILTEDKDELTLDKVTELVKKAGGANYGTGK